LNHEFRDSQEYEITSRASSCEDLEEDNFNEGLYSSSENQSLDDLLWPPKLLHIHQQIRTSNAQSQSLSMDTIQEDLLNEQDSKEASHSAIEPTIFVDGGNRLRKMGSVLGEHSQKVQ